MAKPLKPIVRSGGYYPSAKYTPLVYPGGYTTLNAKNGKPEPLNTFVGKIVRFLAKRSLQMVKIEANFTPIQSLNGQEAPYPPGGGKNLFDPTQSSAAGSAYGLAITRNGDVYTISGTSTNETELNLSFAIASYANGDLSGKGYVCQAFVVGTPTHTIGSTWGFRTESERTFALSLLNVAPNATVNVSLKISVAASEQSAWSPYSNICPISGHTGCDVVVDGKNLLPTLEAANAVKYNGWGLEAADITGGISVTGMASGNGHCVGFLMGKVGKLAGQSVTLSCTMTSVGGSPRALLLLCDNALGNRTNLAYFDSTGSATATIPQGYEDRYIAVSLFSTTGSDSTSIVSSYTDIQLELGSTASDYEAYSGTTVTVSFGTTVYGGKLTVFEDGSFDIDDAMGIVDMGTLNWQYESSVEFPYFWAYGFAPQCKLPPDNSTPANIVSSQYETITANDGYSGTKRTGICINTAPRLIVYDPRYTDKTTFAAAMSGVQLCYERATHTEETGTASQINTLVGENNVWVNAATGDITVQAYGTEIS